MPASRRPKSILVVINCILYPYFLVVTPCYLLNGYRHFGINFYTYIHGAKYSLIFQPLNMRPLGCLGTSSTHFQVTRTPKPQKITIGKKGFYCGKAKNSDMQDITVFCSDSFSDPHSYFRSVLYCEKTGYGAGSCVCILLQYKVQVES